MTPELGTLAQAAGIAPNWRDVHGVWHEVAPDTLRAVLAALGLPAATPAQMAESHATLAEHGRTPAPLVTATAGQPRRHPRPRPLPRHTPRTAPPSKAPPTAR